MSEREGERKAGGWWVGGAAVGTNEEYDVT